MAHNQKYSQRENYANHFAPREWFLVKECEFFVSHLSPSCLVIR